MGIAFVSDINFFELPLSGGAASNDFNHATFLIKERGLDVDIITPINFDHRVKKQYELIIFSNCVSFSHEQLKALADKGPYIVFTHDYYFCVFRLHFPGKNTCKDCPKVEFWRQMHKGAKLNIFLSPLHRQQHEIMFGEEGLGRKCWIPSAMDVDFWSPVEGVQREKGTVLSVNGLAVFKGRYNLYNYAKQHPEMQFNCVGAGGNLDLPNCRYLGSVDREQLRELYSRHEYVIMLPDTAQPFEQVFIEAILMGCKVIGNRNIGATSFPNWDFSDVEKIRFYMRQAAAGFADEIYSVLDEIRGVKRI